MKKILFVVLMALVPSFANAETQAVAKQRLMNILTNYAHIPSRDVPYAWLELTYPLQYATAAELLATTPTEGAVGYAQDSNVFYMRTGSSWAVIADTADPHVIALEATVLASSPADGTLDYATDTNTYWLRSASAWSIGLAPTILKFNTNGGWISNDTNDSLILSENSEDIKFAFTGNLVTISSTTSATFALTPATAITGDLTLNGGAGALTFGAASSSIVVPDASATALVIGSTGLSDAIRIDTTDNAEVVTFKAGRKSDVVNVTGAVTLDASDCGKTMLVTAGIDTNSITLPAVISGCEYTFVYVGADDGALVDISPNSADGIFGTCTLAASIVTFSGTDDADIGLTKIGGNKGDMIRLAGGTDWYVTGCSGIWANN